MPSPVELEPYDEPRRIRGADAPGVFSVLLAGVAVCFAALMLCTCGLSVYIALPLAMAGLVLACFSRGSWRPVGIILNILVLVPCAVLGIGMLLMPHRPANGPVLQHLREAREDADGKDRLLPGRREEKRPVIEPKDRDLDRRPLRDKVPERAQPNEPEKPMPPPAEKREPTAKAPAKAPEASADEEARAAARLRLAKRLIDAGNPAGVRESLQRIIDEHPTTRAAAEARELLEKVGK